MLRKILNIILVVVIIALISVVFINFYNKNRLKSNDFTNSTSEKIKKENKEKNSKKDKNSKKTTEDKKETSDKSNKNSNSTSDDNSKLNNIKATEKNTNDLEINASSDVNVPSTSSSKNGYIAVIGSMIVVLGLSSIVITNRN